MSKTPVYGFCAAGCRREVLPKDRVDVVTQAEYNEMSENGLLKGDCLYLIEDNPTAEKIAEALSVYDEIMAGAKAVPLATNVEHLYLHTATIIVNDIATDGVKIIFSVSYTDASENKKDVQWYANNIVYKGAKICTPVTAVQAGARTAYDYVEFAGASGAYGANLYSAYDGSSKGVQVTSVNAIIANPIQIR